MDWDKANFKKINQRTAESKRWEKRDGDASAEKPARKGSNRPTAKKKKRGK